MTLFILGYATGMVTLVLGQWVVFALRRRRVVTQFMPEDVRWDLGWYGNTGEKCAPGNYVIKAVSEKP